MKRRAVLFVVAVALFVGCQSKGGGAGAAADRPALGYHATADEATVYGVLQIDGREVEIVARCPVSKDRYTTVTINNNEPTVVTDGMMAVALLGATEKSAGVTHKSPMGDVPPSVTVSPEAEAHNKAIIDDMQRCFGFARLF